MTEEEKKILRQKKADCVEWLQENLMAVMTAHEEAFEGTDPRMADYLHGLTWEPDKHNLYELLAAERFLKMMSKYEWRPVSVRRFAAFYEALRFNGTKGRTRYRLTPVQYFQFANIFGFYGSDGLRLIRTAYIFVPRKFSKTTSAASLAVYDMMFGDNNAQAYVGANSYDQAKICFDEIRAIMTDLDPKKRHFKVNREKIMYTDGSRDSFIQCLTANAKTKDGLHASLAIMDEYSQARNTAGKNGADLKMKLHKDFDEQAQGFDNRLFGKSRRYIKGRAEKQTFILQAVHFFQCIAQILFAVFILQSSHSLSIVAAIIIIE